MSEFDELLQNIQRRPALYLGKRSLSQLHAFLDGYTFARREAGIPLTETEKDFESFQEWTEQRFGQSDSQSWSRIILFYSEDEADALERFFELLREFYQRHKRSDLSKMSRVKSGNLSDW